MKNRLQAWLGRKTNSSSFIPEIDGFRFFAIFTVLVYHLNTHLSRVIASASIPVDYEADPLYWISREGGIGVNVFFAISGFILALPFARQHLQSSAPISLKGYYMRRLTRLEPPYIISLLVFFMAHLVLLHENFRDIFPNLLASLFYVHNIVFDQWSYINPVAWSLEVEVQFYILAPALAMLFAIRNPSLRRTVIVGVLLLSLLHYNYNFRMIAEWHLRKSIFMHLHQFLVGFVMADIYLTVWKAKAPDKHSIFDLLGFGGMAVLFIWNEPFKVFDDILFAIALGVTFISLFRGPVINRFFTNRWIVIIGGMCYTIYLIHYAMIAFLADHTRSFILRDAGYGTNLLLQGAIILPLVLGVSGVYFALIERPCMDKDWPKKLMAWIRTGTPK